MLDDSAASTTRRVSIGQRPEDRSGGGTITTDGWCACRTPLTDVLADAQGTADDDDDGGVCWRCRRPIRDA